MDKSKIFGFITIMVLAFLIFNGVSHAEEAEHVLRAGLIDPASHIDTVATERVADLVAERTDGAVEIQVYPASQLGFAPDMMEGMRAGTIEMFVGAVTWLGAFETDYWLPGVLYVFDDQETSREIHRGPYFQELAETMREDHGIRVLTQDWDRKARHFAATESFTSPEEIQGMPIRVPEQESWIKVFELAGTEPSPIALAETFTGLQQGIIQATEQALNWLYFNNYHEVAENIVLTHHNYEQTGVFISEVVYQDLPQEYQEIIEETAKEVTEWRNTMADQEIEYAREQMEAEGANFIEVDVDEWQDYFRDRLWPELQEEIGYSEDLVEHIMEHWE